MDVRQLSYVLAVVDHGSFTRAAEALAVAQPSLSQGVRTLEHELGVELFVRRARPVRLTPAGEALVGPARRAVREVDTARAAVESVRGLTAGHLDLVSQPTLSIDPLAPLVGRFRRAHPSVVVRLVEPEEASDVASQVRSGQCEVGACDLPLADQAGLVSHLLATQGYQVVLPRQPGRRRARRGQTASGIDRTDPGDPTDPGDRREERVSLADLAALPLVTTRVGTSTRRAVDAALASAGLAAAVAVESDHRESLIPLVLAGAGVAVVPDSLVPSALRQGAVVRPLDPPLSRQIGLIHRDDPLSPAAAAFLALALPD